jgi:hypothetical protein
MSSALSNNARSRLESLAQEFADLLAGLEANDARDAERAFTEIVSERRSTIQRNLAKPSKPDIAPIRAALEPVPVPAEVFDSAVRTFDENEVVKAVQEIRAGKGSKLEDFLPDLEKLTRASADGPPA